MDNISVSEISIDSRVFDSFQDCIVSCEAFINDLQTKINSDECPCLIGIEANPLYAQSADDSGDWEQDEMGRLWIFEKTKNSPIARARIYTLPDSEISSQHWLN